MPRVLIVIARLNVGGTTKYISELVNGLHGSQYDVLVVSGKVQGSEREDSIVANLPLVRIKHLGRKISPINDWRARSMLKNVIEEFKPDIVYSHTFKAGLLSRTIKDSIPRIHIFHGHLLKDPEFQGLKLRAILWIERMLARKTKYLVTVGRKVADELLEVGIGVKSQYRSIGPGVTALVLQDREQSRIELGISEELRPVIIWMARITSVKAPKRVAEIAKFIPEAKFLLVGGGDMLDEVAANLPGNVSIVGWQEATTIWAVADLAISTSENEGMPIALIEANLAGVPAIALNVGSVSEVIVSGITGYLFEAFGTDYILKVREIISNKTELRLLGQTAKEYAKVQFVPEKMIRLHLELFEAVLKKT